MDEHETKILHRRGALKLLGGFAAGTVASCSGTQSAHAGEAHEGDEGIPPTEDLMREHGVLRRIFLVYDEAVRRLRTNEALDPALVNRAARLIRTFVEDYHERGEERWVFPAVRRVADLAPTVDALLLQHQRGRVITDEITQLTSQGIAVGSAPAQRLIALCESFTRMYRPHAAREDTVIFPALRAHSSPHEFHEIGEHMEEAEHAGIGEDGFEHAVAEVDGIERALGIQDLSRVTPPGA